MGEAWSWPCAERDVKRPPVQTGKPPVRRQAVIPDSSFFDSQYPIKVKELPTSDLDAFLRDIYTDKKTNNYYPRYIFQSPTRESHTVVLFIPTHMLSTRYTTKFRLHPYSFREREEDLDAELLTYALNSSSRDARLELLGALPMDDSLLMVYGNCIESTAPPRFTVEILTVKFDKQPICDYLNDHKRRGMAFRASVVFNNDVIFVIFEHSSDDGVEYHVGPLTGPVSTLPNVLKDCSIDYTFAGAIVHPSTQSAQLVVKPIIKT